MFISNGITAHQAGAATEKLTTELKKYQVTLASSNQQLDFDSTLKNIFTSMKKKFDLIINSKVKPEPSQIKVLQKRIISLNTALKKSRLTFEKETSKGRQDLEFVAGAETKLDSYSIEKGISDVGRYHWACSFSNALADLSKVVAQPLPRNRAQILEQINVLKEQKDELPIALQSAIDQKIQSLVLSLVEAP